MSGFKVLKRSIVEDYIIQLFIIGFLKAFIFIVQWFNYLVVWLIHFLILIVYFCGQHRKAHPLFRLY